MSILRRLATQTAIFGTGHILAKVLNLSLTWLYTNVDHISPTDYGIFSDVYAFVAMLNIILTFGMETTFFRLIQDTDKPKKIYNQAFLVISVLSVLFLVLIGLLHEEIASLMGYEGQGIWILLMGGVMFLDALAALPMAQLRQQEKARRFVLILLANVVVTVVLNFVFVLFLQKGLTYIFMANLVASAVKLGLAFMGNLPTSLRPDFKILRPVLNYGFFIMIAGLAGAWFSLEATGRFTDGMTDGKGFISLAAMIFGKWTPSGSFGGSLLFGFSEALGFRFQILNVALPPQFLQMVPYIVTLIVLAG
ncbi:MAG: oligosaccharide flippase family protein, partial [Bacteroidota bacterium]